MHTRIHQHLGIRNIMLLLTEDEKTDRFKFRNCQTTSVSNCE